MTPIQAAAVVVGVPLAVCIIIMWLDRKWSGKWWWDD
jgi:hypothetical protein